MTEKQKQRRINALARFTIQSFADWVSARKYGGPTTTGEKLHAIYKERKQQELASLKKKLGVQ